MHRFESLVTTVRRQARPAAAAGCLLASALGVAMLGTVQARTANAASPADDPPTVQVQYGDLNLATDQGARALLERIKAAARQVCPAADGRDLAAFQSSRRCAREAVARAIDQVGSPRLAALYPTHARHATRVRPG